MRRLLPTLAPVLVMLQGGALTLGPFPAFAQIQTDITKDGSDWVQVSTGAIPLCPECKLHVLTLGNVVLRGSATGGRVSFTLRKRVHAASREEAERLFRELTMRFRMQGSLLAMTVSPGRAPGTELSLDVPRIVPQAIVQSMGGDISATDLNGDVQVETMAGRLDLDRLGADALAKTGGGEIRIGRVNGMVRCSSGGGGIRADKCGRESWFETAGGDILIGSVAGAVHATTAGGNIQVDHSDGEVFAHTAAGVIEVQQASGLVTADTYGGAIQVGGSKGVRCQSQAGAIRVRNLGSGPMWATTGVGSILAELLSGTHLQDSLLSTTAGDITVLISSNIAMTVQARNESAGGGRRIISDFPEIRVRPASSTDGGVPLFAEGTLNGGGPVLRIFAAGGTIYLRRQK